MSLRDGALPSYGIEGSISRRDIMRFTKHVIAVCSVAFVLSAFVGKTLVGGCTTDCKEFTCQTNEADCWRFDTSVCSGDTHVRDATGGTCQDAGVTTYYAMCPDCNPECPGDPSEATDCSPALTPGCDPGKDCCEPKSEIDRLVCDLGTP